MINIIRKEPVIKKSIFIMMMSIIVIFSIFTVFQYNNLKNIYLEQENINKRVVGILVNKYPQQEVDIVKSIYKQDNRYLDLGAKTLDKYGYDNNYNMYENVNFKEHLKYFLVNNLTVFVIIIILVSFIVFNFTKYMYNRLLKVNSDIENIINNKYIAQEEFKEEGVFNRIYTDLNKLSRSLNLKISSLDKEKESIKELVTDISHQLKTPLASISMCNSILEEDELTLEEKKEFFEMSNKNINKLHSLIDSLVNISRLEVAMIKLKPEYNNLANTIIRAYNSAYIKAKNKKIDINLGEIKEDIVVKHDIKWTEEAIFNVLENGIKYTNEGGKIYLDIEESLNYIKINIKDNGRGINKKEFNNIFKRFYRCKSVEQDNIEGSGVGLYLTRKILEDQGGSIMVKSVEGQGSEFTLLLPKN